MNIDSQQILDNIFLSYNKILIKLHNLGLTTKHGKEISHMDLRKAIDVMLKKHPTCRWRSEKIKSKRYYILFEGYLWLIYVYFQSEKSQIDADVVFFETRIKQYEKVLQINSMPFWNEDIPLENLETYFNRKRDTIYKAIKKMNSQDYKNTFSYYDNNKLIISKEGVEWLCKNCFKQKYLALLENYKMQLTEKYIELGYIYDNFFGMN